MNVPSMSWLGFENTTLPGNEKMGKVDASYLLETLPNLYLGPVAYGAISGKRGVFFTSGGGGGSVQHYVQAARRDGSFRDLKTMGFKMDRDLEHGLYLSGQAHSAMTGAAGGYSVGLFDMGWKTPNEPYVHKKQISRCSR